MDIWQAIVLGIVEGITEFLPISSTGHLTITEKLLDLPVDDPAVTGYTAVIQIGAIAAVFVYFWKDIVRLTVGWVRGLLSPVHRQDFDYRFGWYVIAGSLPILAVGFLARGIITGPLRNLWWVAGALILWSVPMVLAERVASQTRSEKELTLADTLIIGTAQCLALVPGVSRSGATITVGLFRGLDRVTATRLSFFLSIPALTAAGIYELPEAMSDSIGVLPIVVGTVVSFVVAYAAVAWLLRFVAHHTIVVFVWYRLALGALLIAALATGWLAAT
ncbi:MAG TPA: undecaprenyl-diphosphate phosphatase [Micromonosporaceae bacterium]|nr:undecaprenyl-diphosphate phosphatase [Micromonosporaceae bacterium]